MNLIANGRLTDLGALGFAIVVTVAIFWAVIAKAHRTGL